MQGGDRAVYYGAMDVPLSPLGEMEAIEAASYLSRFNLQHIAASPLSRAKFGARQVAAQQPGRSDTMTNINTTDDAYPHAPCEGLFLNTDSSIPSGSSSKKHQTSTGPKFREVLSNLKLRFFMKDQEVSYILYYINNYSIL